MSGRLANGKSVRFKSIKGEFPHGTVARYVAGCRCEECRCALREKAKTRARAAKDAALSLVPSGPPGLKTIYRGGTPYRVKACPGVGGAECVRGGTWLKNTFWIERGLCVACAERATVWNGLVSAAPARAHLIALSRKGIGRLTVSGACDVAHSLLAEVYGGKATRIRQQTLRRILSVDEGCRTEGNRVPARPTRLLVEKILAKGFTQTWLSRQLGCAVYVFSKDSWNKRHVSAGRAAAVEKLWRQVKAGKFVPRPRWLDAAPTHALLRAMLATGLSMSELAKRLGYPLQEKTFRNTRVRPETAEKVATLHAEMVSDEDGDVRVVRLAPLPPLQIDDFAQLRAGGE